MRVETRVITVIGRVIDCPTYDLCPTDPIDDVSDPAALSLTADERDACRHALNKEFGIILSPEAEATAKTVSDWISLVAAEIRKGPPSL